jgi:hypothetical protein
VPAGVAAAQSVFAEAFTELSSDLMSRAAKASILAQRASTAAAPSAGGGEDLLAAMLGVPTTSAAPAKKRAAQPVPKKRSVGAELAELAAGGGTNLAYKRRATRPRHMGLSDAPSRAPGDAEEEEELTSHQCPNCGSRKTEVVGGHVARGDTHKGTRARTHESNERARTP